MYELSLMRCNGKRKRIGIKNLSESRHGEKKQKHGAKPQQNKAISKK